MITLTSWFDYLSLLNNFIFCYISFIYCLFHEERKKNKIALSNITFSRCTSTFNLYRVVDMFREKETNYIVGLFFILIIIFFFYFLGF